MEQATIDYFDTIIVEVIKRNPKKFADLIQSELQQTAIKDWLTTKELCDKIGTTVSTWSKSEVRYHPVVAAARKTDTSPFKYKASQVSAIQKIWDARRYVRGKS